jgi:hypothetical protein
VDVACPHDDPDRAARRRVRNAFGRGVLALAAALAVTLAPRGAPAAEIPPAPDYASPAAWAALPERPGRAADRPEGVPAATRAEAPVFFVHPTTDLSPTSGNARFDAGGEVGARVDGVVLRFQAAVFNGCCRIYAPRYRQATLHAVTANSAADYAADDLAYQDVSRAFSEFLRREPDGPFLVAGHSQGAIHVLRLLEERIVHTPLKGRLVAAYDIGVALPAAIESLGLPICRRADDTGCVISWNTVRRGHDDRRRRESAVIWWDGRYQPVAGRPLVCVNPLSWRLAADAPAAANLGAVYGEGRGRPIPPPVVALTGAWCEDGLLGVDVPLRERRHFGDLLTLTGVYHDFDYGLFYMNLRENAARRAAAWTRAPH